jgi:hypothetical protein
MKRCLLLILFAVPAFAQLPPNVTKSFTPAVVEVNQSSILTITISNPNGVAITGASIIDNYPAGMVTAGTASTTCGSGSVFTTTTSVSLSSGTLPANGSCTITVPVSAAAPGSYLNATGHVFSTAPASITFGLATLQVVPMIPTLSSAALLLLGAMLAAVGMILSRR